MFLRRRECVLILVGLIIGFLVGGLFFGCAKGSAGLETPGAVQSIPGALAAAPLEGGASVVAEIAAQAGPAVVKIETVTQTGIGPLFSDPFFRQFFGDRLGFPTQQGVGSGFIISPDGYILTNEHVIHGASEIQVSVVGYDKPFPARVTGSDYDLDLAILKIDPPQSLPVLKLGDSEAMRVGDWVVAIGNPYGLDHTVTVGVISAKGRPINIEDRHYENLLQTDAAINPGNSGGPLLNLKGEVIGINTAVSTQAQGIGFAIPTSSIKPVLDELLTKGKVSRPWLGVYLGDVTPQVARYLGLARAEGALVIEVQAKSPAAKAGLKSGDVILEIDGVAIKDASSAVKEIQRKEVGQKVSLVISRQGKTLTLKAVIGEKP